MGFGRSLRCPHIWRDQGRKIARFSFDVPGHHAGLGRERGKFERGIFFHQLAQKLGKAQNGHQVITGHPLIITLSPNLSLVGIYIWLMYDLLKVRDLSFA